MRLNYSICCTPGAHQILRLIDRYIEAMAMQDRTITQLVITNSQANIMQIALNKHPEKPIVTNCSYRGYQLVVDPDGE